MLYYEYRLWISRLLKNDIRNFDFLDQGFRFDFTITNIETIYLYKQIGLTSYKTPQYQ